MQNDTVWAASVVNGKLLRAIRVQRTWLVFLLFSSQARTLGGQQPTISLAEAIRRAQQVQPAVVQALTTASSADAQVLAAKGAFLPSVNATSSFGPSFSSGPARTNPVTGQISPGGQSVTSLSTGINARIDLFTGFRREANLRSAHATQTAAEAGLVDAKYQMALLTTQTFLDALSGRELLRVRQASVERAEEQLKVSIAKLKTGSATLSDSLKSLVTLGTAQSALVTAETQLATAEAGLGRLVGMDGRVTAADDSAFYHVLPTIDSVTLAEEAMASSPLVRNMDAQAQAAQAAVTSSKEAYWPTLSLSGSASWNGSNTNDYELFNQRQLNLSLSWPLFNGFVREQTITVSQSAADLADATAIDSRRQVRANLTTHLAELNAARTQIEITKTSVRAAEEDLRVQRERYRVGASTIVDVLLSQESLTQAEVDAVNARFDYLRAKAQIEALIGRPL